jgi:hypothetical protein
MKIIFKFYDGTNGSTEVDSDTLQGGDLFRSLLEGKKNDANITINDLETQQQIKKTYSELQSVEIVF